MPVSFCLEAGISRAEKKMIFQIYYQLHKSFPAPLDYPHNGENFELPLLTVTKLHTADRDY